MNLNMFVAHTIVITILPACNGGFFCTIKFMQETTTDPGSFAERKIQSAEIIDLSDRSLREVLRALSQQVIEHRLLLHGSRTPDLTELSPSQDNDKLHSPVVYATDAPHIALVRASAGDKIVSWDSQMRFMLCDDDALDHIEGRGYIYGVSPDNMRGCTDDPAEYVSTLPKRALKVFTIDASIAKPILRPPTMINDSIDADGQWKTEKILYEDRLMACEALSHLARLFVSCPLGNPDSADYVHKVDLLRRFKRRLEDLKVILLSVRPDERDLRTILDALPLMMADDLSTIYAREYDRITSEYFCFDEYNGHAFNPANINWREYSMTPPSGI